MNQKRREKFLSWPWLSGYRQKWLNDDDTCFQDKYGLTSVAMKWKLQPAMSGLRYGLFPSAFVMLGPNYVFCFQSALVVLGPNYVFCFQVHM